MKPFILAPIFFVALCCFLQPFSADPAGPVIFQIEPTDTTGLRLFCNRASIEKYDETLSLWREFNACAEVGWQEYRTQGRLITHFTTLQNRFGAENILFDTMAGTGLFVEIPGDPKSGRTLIVRPEIDGLYYPPTDSTLAMVRHACGHNTGMSVACSLAEILLENKKKKKIPWKAVLFLFSPSEERAPSGLDSMLAGKDLSRYGKIVALGQHVSPDVPNHQVEVRSGTAQASSEILRIYIDASALKGGHIADKTNINPLEIWENMRSEIEQEVESCSAGGEYLLRWSNIITSSPDSTPVNVLPQKVKVFGNFRTFNPVHEVRSIEKIDSLIANFSARYADKKVLIYRVREQAIPVLVNDPVLTESVKKWGSAFLKRPINTHKLRLGADDFAIFRKYKIPAVLIRLGVKANGGLHRQDFEIMDPTILQTSLGLFTFLVYSLE
ncbi:MAG: M20/M25/M40 family metallo-hydrolase [Lewinella sp.]|nr:M20/M25/M40 family metallo-hydrolase [Lewinella sp.]